MKLFRGKNRKKKEDANAQSLIQKQDPAGLLEVSLDLPIGRLDKTPSTHLVKATRISGGVKSPMTMTVMPSPASSGMQAASISSRNAVAVAVPQKLPSAVKMSKATVKIPPPRAMTIPLAASNKEPPERSMGESQDSISHHLASNLDLYEQAENCAVTRELVKKYVADIWNRGEVELIPEVCHPSLRFNGSVGMDRVGHQGFARMVAVSSVLRIHCHFAAHCCFITSVTQFNSTLLY